MGTAAATRLGLVADARASRPAEGPARQSDGFTVALGAATSAIRPAGRQTGGESEPGEAVAESLPTALPLMQLLLPATPPADARTTDGQHVSLLARDASNPDATQQLPDGELIDAARFAEQLEPALQYEAALADNATAVPDADSASGDATTGLLRQLLQPAAAMPAGAATDSRLAAHGADLPGGTSSLVAGPALPLQPSSATPAAGTPAAADPGLRQLVGSPRWADELGSRLVMMSVRGQNEGSLSLAPEHLGPLEVRISMSQGSTHVWFGAQHADTRAALAEALPRLREMFADAGLSLGQAGVSQQAPRRDMPESSAFGAMPADELVDPPTTTATSPQRLTSALLDIYA